MLGLVCCLLISSAYVGVLYIWRGHARDDPRTVVLRLGCITAVCLTSWAPVFLAARDTCDKQAFLRFQKQFMPVLGDDSVTVTPWLSLLGLRWDGILLAAAVPLCLTASLFAAPLVLLALDISEDMLPNARRRHWLLNLRDFAAAPITEEWAFRACMAPLLCMEGWSVGWATAVTPLFFGAAHLHHAHEMVKHHGIPAAQALRTSGFQMAYTTIFGWYAAWLFLRTGHLVSAVISHMFCNFIGFPDFARMANHRRHSRLFLALLVGGILVFAVCLGPLTRPELYSWDTDLWIRPCSVDVPSQGKFVYP